MQDTQTQENALATTGNTDIQTQDNAGEFLPQTFEQFEMIKELQKSAAEIESLAQKTTPSKDLIGVGFSIIDAWVTEIQDDGKPKDVVCFKLELDETLEQVVVMKNANGVNLTYVKFFSNWKAVNKPQVLAGYTFKTEPKYHKAGNDAIILVKQPKQIKQVNKAK